jgi:DNA-binding beta-propeller fold protein YncE
MKKVFGLFILCASLPVAFSSCGDDEEDKLLPPAHAASNLAFTDTDPERQKIGGALSWQLPDQETNIDGYVIYLGDSHTSKGEKLGEAGKSATSFDVPAGTAWKAYLLVVARNAAGESTNIAYVAVGDFDESDEPAPLLPQTSGVFILNRGNWNANNASLSYYNLLEKTMIPSVYKTVNGSDLGDSAEQMLIYGSKIYVTVTTSSRLVVLDETGKLLKELPASNDAAAPLSPRGLAAAGGKVYVSYYDGESVAALDTASLTIEKTTLVGRYPERLAVAGGKLYVANSGGGDYPNYGHTVSVVDLESFSVEKEIEVTINPVRLVADSQGDVYLISMGDYGAVPNTLQRIDGTTGEVSTLGNGSLFSLANDKLYVIDAPWGAASVGCKKYDLLTETVESENFLAETPAGGFTAISAIGVDPLTGKIYITDSGDYTSSGTLHVFSSDGRLETSVDTGGFDPNDIVFHVQWIAGWY